MTQLGSVLWPKLKALQVYGANTGVGKTVFSVVLCRAFMRHFPSDHVHYVKPVSTGPLEEADDRHLSKFGNGVTTECLFQFDKPISPHLAAASSAESTSDHSILAKLHEKLSIYAHRDDDRIALVETAGAVLSPAPSRSSQADLYRPLRLPVLLVGDHRLGGIGTTISAWESLHLRGYDVQSIGLFEDGNYGNFAYLSEYFADRGVNAFGLPQPPDPSPNVEQDTFAMGEYYEDASSSPPVAKFVKDFVAGHDLRVKSIREMPQRADKAIWHPFMQHTDRSKDTIVAIDSAYGDYFQTYSTKQDSATTSTSLLKPAFDGSASWWTQGLGHGNPKLALVAANAAGRYGHVMFASAVHEPALTLAETLLTQLGNPRLSKVFYTDNGSTGMEVAVKMALKAASKRYSWNADEDVLIMGLKGSYHGDTIGTMDCSEPSTYNKKVEWYKGRGHWFDFPQVKMRKGRWVVESPAELGESMSGMREFSSLDEVFDLEKRATDRRRYMRYIMKELEVLEAEGKKFGALIMEPVLLGAGGMLFADPLFQRCLVDAVRSWQSTLFQNANKHTQLNDPLAWTGMPVIFDEVFTGLYRLGRFNAASFLGVDPDIVVNAKLLTGGLLPLCTTTASEGIFAAFLSSEKSDALLHGHSYTAHAVGCAVANESLSAMGKLQHTAAWDGFKKDWQTCEPTSGIVAQGRIWSMWSQSFVTDISHKENVDSVFALGSVLAILLRDPSGSGYTSTAATGIRDRLLHGTSEQEWVVHSRVLGNVLYLMAAMTTSKETLLGVEKMVTGAIDA